MEDYTVVVGSTGNLGLSVGLAASSMGMRSTIHMSSDAKEWKKSLLRQQRGCEVVEHQGSYSDAVSEGRKASASDAMSHFVDDETSRDLFLGYACAAEELRQQLEEGGYYVAGKSAARKIVVYIPCGVGGAPSGICWGLKNIFGDTVVVLFGEPTHAPCVMLALGDATKKSGDKKIMTCMDVGLDVVTEADGASFCWVCCCDVSFRYFFLFQ
jgi:D-serine dehydratase